MHSEQYKPYRVINRPIRCEQLTVAGPNLVIVFCLELSNFYYSIYNIAKNSTLLDGDCDALRIQ